MCIILRLVCENLSGIAAKISFLWGPRHHVYVVASFSANVMSRCSHNDTQFFTSVILYMNIIFIAQWLSGGNSEILHCSNICTCPRKLCKPESIFKQTRVNFFYRENDVISKLRHSYAKDPFCVTQLIYHFISHIGPGSDLLIGCATTGCPGAVGSWPSDLGYDAIPSYDVPEIRFQLF